MWSSSGTPIVAEERALGIRRTPQPSSITETGASSIRLLPTSSTGVILSGPILGRRQPSTFTPTEPPPIFGHLRSTWPFPSASSPGGLISRIGLRVPRTASSCPAVTASTGTADSWKPSLGRDRIHETGVTAATWLQSGFFRRVKASFRSITPDTTPFPATIWSASSSV